MKLNFKSDDSLQAAKRIIVRAKTGDKNEKLHSVPEAFILLIKGVGKENLDNLCEELKGYYPELTEDELYNLTQGEGEIFEKNSSVVATVIFNCANNCIAKGKHMGNNEIAGGKINQMHKMLMKQ